MRITKRSDLAMRVLMYCAINEGRTVTKAEIAGGCNSSENHTGQVVNRLARNGYLRTIRGRGGGLCLERPAAEISVGEVMRIMESDVPVTECFSANTNSCPLVPSCKLRIGISGAVDAFYGYLDGMSVGDLVAENTGLRETLSRQVAAQ